jgi:tRNA-specific adenosine deaminase 3
MMEIDPSYYLSQLQPILHVNETREAEFVPVYISTVINMKTTSALISYLGSKFPLTTLSHLKRVRKVINADGTIGSTEVIIGPISDVQYAPSEFREYLSKHFELVLKEYEVPMHEPLMRSQYDAWSVFWPMVCKAHIPSTPPSKDSFSNEQLRLFVSSMRKLIPIAQQTGNACIVLNADGTELGIACSSSQSSLSHCCINVINAVAELQSLNAKDEQYTHQKRTTIIVPSDPKPIEYLCTGCTAILVREPCIMCSMALLHSRIACVIYAIPNESQGGLGSRFSIHCETRLNHHFHVYKGLLAEEVAKTMV